MNEINAKSAAPINARPGEPMVLCPYCGNPTAAGARCTHCRGLLDPLSRQASQNAMGPWFLHDPAHPFRPGCSYETIAAMVRRAKISPQTIIRGPTTRQFWSIARRTPGVANLLGMCHACQADIQPTDRFCDDCGASFLVETDRQHLGLAAVHLLPGQATPEDIASAGARPGVPAAPAPVVEHVSSSRLQEAAAVRRVLERRLRTQRRLVGLLMMVLLVGVLAALWAGFRFVPGSTLGTWFGDMERGLQNIGRGSAVADAPPPPPPAPAPSLAPEQPEIVEVPPPSAPEPAAPSPTPVLQDESQAPAAGEPPVPEPAVQDPTWTRINDLVKRDTKESLTEAQTLLKGERPASVGEALWNARLTSVNLRLDQLKLRGLP